MSGFDATLKQLCAGTASLEAALAAFHRERPDDRNVLLHFRLIESAWRAGKLNRKSYDVLRSAALARSAGLVPSADGQQPAGMADNPMIAPRSPVAGSEGDSEHASMEVRAERRTRLHAPASEPKHRASDASVAEPARSNSSRVPDAGPLTDPSRSPREATQPLGAGSVLKERFVLERVIGRGGMGTIFRARDMRKEEAQDRRPYVAVKVLNEDFRRHPEALISLQREARKAQTLAHPNIATVFDFDRDGPVVFLVMELLEGVTLNGFIKSRVGRPLPGAEAMRIVQALGAALAHAHQKGLVHADFKPANAFRAHDGTVKVLDFGIARAIGQRMHDDGEHTVFDPASLGALTPCYASPEMLVGDVPDPRDDVYAFACVAYELFCSRHPFDFISSQVAERRGLKPAPIQGLDRRIWRALLHGLEFSRERRTPSVDAFLAEMAPAHRSRVAATVATLVATVALGVVSWNLIPGYLNDRAHARHTAELKSGDPIVIDALLPRLLEIPAPQRRTLFDDTATRDALINHMQRKIRSVIDPANERVDYDQAERYVDQLDRLLPDASGADRLRADLEAGRQKLDAAIRQQTASVTQPPPENTRQAGSPVPASGSASESVATVAPAPPVAPATPPEITATPEPESTIARRKERLVALAAADDLTSALELLRGLQSEIPSDDPFMKTDAPGALAQTYIRLSARAFDSGEFESAAALLTRAGEFNPEAPEIEARRESVDRVAHVAHTLEFVIAFSVDRVIADLENIEVSEGRRFPLIRTQLAEILAQRITEAQSTAPQRANELLDAARRIFPDSPVFASLRPSEATLRAGP